METSKLIVYHPIFLVLPVPPKILVPPWSRLIGFLAIGQEIGSLKRQSVGNYSRKDSA
jgi:hypothetical protein